MFFWCLSEEKTIQRNSLPTFPCSQISDRTNIHLFKYLPASTRPNDQLPQTPLRNQDLERSAAYNILDELYRSRDFGDHES